MYEIAFRPLQAADLPLLTAWLAEPHVRRFYQKQPVTLRDVALEYGPTIRAEEPSLSHLAILNGAPFAYLQCYRNVDYPEWGAVIDVDDGVSIDLFIGDPACLRRGAAARHWAGIFGRSPFRPTRGNARLYRPRVDQHGGAAMLAGGRFRPLRRFLEDGLEMMLLALDREP
jgi:hypothetical protein